MTSDEDFLRGLVGGASPSEVTALDLSNGVLAKRSGLLSLLAPFTALESLQLGSNAIVEFPDKTPVLASVTDLDVSDNNLKSADFLANFPSVKRLRWSGNGGLDKEAAYVAVVFAKKLETINGRPVEDVKASVKKLRKILFKLVTGAHHLHATEIEQRVLSGSVRHDDVVEEIFRLVSKRLEGKDTDDLELPNLTEKIIRELISKYLEQIYEMPPAIPEPFVSAEGTKIKLGLKALSDIEDYDPVYFFRAHGANGESMDKETKIWRAAFKPGSHTFATCGGNYVCLIDADASKVTFKYRLPEEDFYTVAWINLKIAGTSDRKWMLVTAGFRGCIRLLRPDRMTCVADTKAGSHKAHVNALLVHPKDDMKLFSGSADQSVTLWDIDPLPSPSLRTSFQPLFHFVVPSGEGGGPNDVLNILVNGDYLVAATENDIVFWRHDKIPPVSSPSSLKKTKSSRKRTHEFVGELPFMLTEYSVVDGMTPLGPSRFVASKYYRDGVISIWDLEATVAAYLKRKKSKEDGHEEEENVDCQLVTRLKWSDSDELYINVGASSDGRLLVAGDDNGNIWMYNLGNLKMFGGEVVPIMKVGEEEDILQPSKIMPWPELFLEDPTDVDAPDINFKNKKIMINHLAVSDDRKFVVGCTDVNIVCVWKRVEATFKTQKAF